MTRLISMQGCLIVAPTPWSSATTGPFVQRTVATTSACASTRQLCVKTWILARKTRAFLLRDASLRGSSVGAVPMAFARLFVTSNALRTSRRAREGSRFRALPERPRRLVRVAPETTAPTPTAWDAARVIYAPSDFMSADPVARSLCGRLTDAMELWMVRQTRFGRLAKQDPAAVNVRPGWQRVAQRGTVGRTARPTTTRPTTSSAAARRVRSLKRPARHSIASEATCVVPSLNPGLVPPTKWARTCVRASLFASRGLAAAAFCVVATKRCLWQQLVFARFWHSAHIPRYSPLP